MTFEASVLKTWDPDPGVLSLTLSLNLCFSNGNGEVFGLRFL